MQGLDGTGRDPSEEITKNIITTTNIFIAIKNSRDQDLLDGPSGSMFGRLGISHANEYLGIFRLQYLRHLLPQLRDSYRLAEEVKPDIQLGCQSEIGSRI